MFSATLHSPEVKALGARICQNPIVVDLKGKDAVPETGGMLGGEGGGARAGEAGARPASGGHGTGTRMQAASPQPPGLSSCAGGWPARS